MVDCDNCDYTDNNNFPFTPYRRSMKVQGKSNADWGFQNPVPGWHLVEYQEGIGPQTKDDNGTRVEQYDDRGKLKYVIPGIIKDDDDQGKRTTIFIQQNARGEQAVMDVLENAGLGEHFAKMFPGDVSIFDPAPWAEVVKQLPGRFNQQLLEENKKGYMNIKGLLPAGVKPPEDTKGGGKVASSAPVSDWK